MASMVYLLMIWYIGWKWYNRWYNKIWFKCRVWNTVNR